jgi:hypothetical protein
VPEDRGRLDRSEIQVEHHSGVNADNSWTCAIDRYSQSAGGAVAELNVSILSALRERWEPVIDVELSMFDLNLTPAGRTVRDVTSPLTFRTGAPSATAR